MLKSIKQQAEEWWAGTAVIDPLKPARWVIRGGWGDARLDCYRNPFVFDQDDGGPPGPKGAD
jgi:hypothetical protein